MRSLPVVVRGQRLSILCLGAHSDDIEIGAGGTILHMIAEGALLDIHWCVLSGSGNRATEAHASALDFLAGASSKQIEIAEFEDSYFPSQSRELKVWLNELRERVSPDVIFTHARSDAHQDHREVNQLTTNVFRDHLVLEYEIPKWDGDLMQHNVYVPLATAVMQRKIELLMKHFGSQRSKDWFDEETFSSLARLRGMECRSPSRFAEAFTTRKLTLEIG
ncbi:PIG-L deacetylase family protein [Phyllobacterium sp. OV277]|uniref:PIG-L deacetylase family protein n=1 Tax=Phyllobacterium sp. OV277 TaxID=1882772 RepID=UPI000891E1DA|nr:PIG-L deacetylase family protein [Phyllobacterium sp. OV277]SDP38181.1 N-acetylglucosaminyl deacetylase, LmbE family [Phyllobacterium sp. OV277]